MPRGRIEDRTHKNETSMRLTPLLIEACETKQSGILIQTLARARPKRHSSQSPIRFDSRKQCISRTTRYNFTPGSGIQATLPGHRCRRIHPLHSSCITLYGTKRHPDSGCLKHFCPFLPLPFLVPFFNNNHLSEIVYNHFLKHLKPNRFNVTTAKLAEPKHIFQHKHERLNC